MRLGDYLFTGLAAGTYHVTLADAANDVVTSPGGVSQTVPVPDGPPVGGINFQVQPAPDLTATSFQLDWRRPRWASRSRSTIR